MSRRRIPLEPGKRCPNERTASSHDPAVRITDKGEHYRRGRRTCGRCGRLNVGVEQAWGRKVTAWYYDPHLVPLGRMRS